MPRHKRRAWPALAKLDTKRLSSRPETPDIIRKLLQSKETFDQIDDSCSDISDVFEEFHRNSFYNVKKSGNKSISKYDADLLTMAEFTEDFKNTMKITKDALQIESGMTNENLDTVEKVIKAPKEEKALPETLKDEINKLLSEPDKISVEIYSATSASKKSDEDLSYDYMSGIWSMIGAHCKDTKFTISPINFDVYNQSQPHWLERPDISQEVIDNSKRLGRLVLSTLGDTRLMRRMDTSLFSRCVRGIIPPVFVMCISAYFCTALLHLNIPLQHNCSSLLEHL